MGVLFIIILVIMIASALILGMVNSVFGMVCILVEIVCLVLAACLISRKKK